jgi:CRP-like cAMP-binding protein
VKGIAEILVDQPLFESMAPEYLDHIAGCASNVRFKQREQIFKDGDAADFFYLVRHGRVGLDIFVPHRGPVTIETVKEGEVLGWSWLFPPYKRQYDARAIVLTRAVAFDGRCLRTKSEENKEFGYDLMKRFAQVMIDRLHHVRIQMLDIYGDSTKR